MKKIYAILDTRNNEWLTDPIIVENDTQASLAYLNFQKQLLDQKLVVSDTRLYKIGTFNNDEPKTPISIFDVIEECPIFVQTNDEN